MTTDSFAQGTTAPQDFQLLTVDATGTETPFDATAGTASAVYTITLALKVHATGVAVAWTGTVAWLTPAQGIVRYTPAATDLLAASSPYDVRWTVTDGAGHIASFPDGIADRWVVRL